jgi:hypothetical protein
MSKLKGQMNAKYQMPIRLGGQGPEGNRPLYLKLLRGSWIFSWIFVIGN